MVVAGIDASTNKTGIAIFEDGKYETHVLIDLHKERNAGVRLPKMMMAICDYLDEHKVDKVIMEESILKNNIATVKMLSNIAGAIMYYTAVKGIEFELVLPSVWRKRIGLTQGKMTREMLKAEAILAMKQEYGMELTDDEAESCLMARSGFNLPKIVLMEDEDEI